MNVVKTSNMRRGAFLGLALLLCAGAASAQMYKWVDANGRTHFTDTPPPATAKKAEIKATGSAGGSSELPFALAKAAREHPVTLYTTTSCGGCDSGRALLRSKGIPFTEKTVSSSADEEKLKEAGGGASLPFLMVGRASQTGFNAPQWEAMLTAASYPAKKVLPDSYQYPAAVAAAPKPQKAEPDRDAVRMAASEAEQARRKRAEAAKTPTAPPGFQF